VSLRSLRLLPGPVAYMLTTARPSASAPCREALRRVAIRGTRHHSLPQKSTHIFLELQVHGVCERAVLHARYLLMESCRRCGLVAYMTVRVPMLQRHACVSARDSTAHVYTRQQPNLSSKDYNYYISNLVF
jgi:hypothetical protein